ncbi:MAG: potassium channel protein [Acidobacteriota bacterium]
MQRLLRIKYVFSLLLLIIVVGTFGYTMIEGWTLFDSFYMTIITIFTIGYSEVNPLSNAGRIFNILIIFFGVGTVFYLAASIMEEFVENRLIKGKKMEKDIQKIRDHYIVCGYGRMGSVICKDLALKGVPFVVVENDHGKIRAIEEEGYLHCMGDVTDDRTLSKTGIERAKGVVTVLSEDADNVFVTLTARGLNPGIFIVARSNTEGSVQKLLRAGANKVINPFSTAGKHMSQLLLKPVVVDFMEVVSQDSSLDLRMEEVNVCERSLLSGIKLKDSLIRKELNIIIVAIKKEDGRMVFNPSSETEISSRDVLIALGSRENLQKLEDLGRG